jgi:hypothetical protein
MVLENKVGGSWCREIRDCLNLFLYRSLCCQQQDDMNKVTRQMFMYQSKIRLERVGRYQEKRIVELS